MGFGDALENPTLLTVGGTGNLLATNELPVDMHPSLFNSYTDLTPLTVILSKLGEDQAKNFRSDWQEKKEIPTTVICATSEASAGTSINVVDNGITLVQDTLLFNPRTFDLRIVDSTPTTNAITVTISQGGTTSAAWDAGDVIHVLLPALAENDEHQTRHVSVADVNMFNYVQLCKLSFALTLMQGKMPTYFGGAGTKEQELQGQKYREYRIKKEKLVMFGGRATGGTAPATRRMMGGLVHHLRNGTLYKNFNGFCTESGFRSWLGDYKDQNPDATNVMLFAGSSLAETVSLFGKDKIRISPESKTYGLWINRYQARGLTCDIVPMPLMSDAITGGWGFLLDLNRTLLKAIDKDTYFPWDRSPVAGEVKYNCYRGAYTMIVATESRHAMCVGADA